jgi:translation initiation factor IF-2
MRPRLALLALLLLAPFAAPGVVHAQPSGAQPLDRLLPEIRRAHPGRFLDVEPGASESGSPRYRLRWLTPEGRVIWLDADARTGQVMGQGPDRESFGRQRPGPPPRGNFRAPAFDQDEDPRSGFGNRFAPRPGFGTEDGGAAERAAPQDFNRDRFNRPSFEGGGFGNREGFGGRRFGGDGAMGRGRFGGERPFGGGRGRGRGPSE